MKHIQTPLLIGLISTVLLFIEYFHSPFGQAAHQVFPSLFSCPVPEQVSSLPPCAIYDIWLMLILVGIILTCLFIVVWKRL
jgi:hypothetical protein